MSLNIDCLCAWGYLKKKKKISIDITNKQKTQVDAEGVVTAKGNCDDERNTAFDGPDADNTCKMPFFWDGRWYENCTLYPKDDYWCATKINPDTREMLDGESSVFIRTFF